MPNVEHELLTSRQVCELLQISRPTLDACTHRGLPVIRLSPTANRFRRADIEVWLASREVKRGPQS